MIAYVVTAIVVLVTTFVFIQKLISINVGDVVLISMGGKSVPAVVRNCSMRLTLVPIDEFNVVRQEINGIIVQEVEYYYKEHNAKYYIITNSSKIKIGDIYDYDMPNAQSLTDIMDGVITGVKKEISWEKKVIKTKVRDIGYAYSVEASWEGEGFPSINDIISKKRSGEVCSNIGHDKIRKIVHPFLQKAYDFLILAISSK
jgi:hypothetical protein